MALQTGKAVTVLFDEVMEQFALETSMLNTTSVFRPEAGLMQNSNNVIWRQIEQQAPVKTGFDMTGQFGNVIELSYPSSLGSPKNDVFSVRGDDFRDEQFIKRRGAASAKRLAAEINKDIATLVRDSGSLFYRKTLNATSGYAFLSEADSILTERQEFRGEGCSFFLNPRAYNIAGQDLAQRGTLSGRPEKAWATGQVGKDLAGFDVYKSAFMQTLAGGASPATTVSATVSLKPVASQTVGGQVLPVDYRYGDIPFTSAAGWNVGDRIGFANVFALGSADKTNTQQQMTFTITAINGNTVTVTPRPIALSDAALTADEKAYANINTQIASGAVPIRLNTDALATTNAFWCNDSIEVIAGSAPWEEMSKLSGWKVVSETMPNGVTVYMAYDGSIATMDLQVRVFTWYGVVNRDPSRNGIAINI